MLQLMKMPRKTRPINTVIDKLIAITVTLTAKQQFAVKLQIYLILKTHKCTTKKGMCSRQLPLNRSIPLAWKNPQPSNSTFSITYAWEVSFGKPTFLKIPAEFKFCLQNMSW